MKDENPLPLWLLFLAVVSLSFSVKLFLFWELWGCTP